MAITATIPIDDHDSETAYYIAEYKANGDIGYTTLQPQYDSPIEITNLAEETEYDYRITRVCTSGEQSTTATGSFDTGDVSPATSPI